MLLIAALALAIALVGHGIADVPGFEIEARQTGDALVFTFFRKEGWFLFKRRVPHEIFELSVHMKGGEPQLWLIESLGLRHVTVTYGVVPEGFFQKMPTAGKAPVLRPDTTYYVSARGGGIGVRAFTIGQSR